MNESVLGDRYRIEANIGSGGMAEVYRGFDPVLNRTVAVKVLLPQFARDAGFVARFRREAQAAARLNHPNIVGVFDTGADGDTQYIVMEFVEGRTLADFMAAGRKPTPVQAAEIAQKICAALSAAHAQGVIHRDIKPGNVMVTRDGTVKVMDFGIARLTTGVETAPQTSAVLGTASYLSPEQAQGSPVDARSDIYSAGTVLYEMLTGRPPFMGDSPVAVAYKQVNEAPVPPSQINADVPPRMDAVVMRALSKNPANRYQTAQDFSDDLQRVIDGQDVEATPLLPAGGDATQVISRPPATSVLPPQVEEKGSGRKVWLGVLIGVLVVGILGGGGYLLVNALTKDDTGEQLIEVPDVTTLSFTKAQSVLGDLGLRVQDPPETKVDDTVKPGTVLSQDPAKGEKVAKNSIVVLTVAKASATVPVPSLEGLTVSQAQAALTDAGLILGSQLREASSTVDPDLVIRSEPAVGTDVPKGQAVDLILSSGPEMVAVPDVTSDCLSVGAANSRIRSAGLVPAIGDPVAPNPLCTNPSRIAFQDPAAGTQVEKGSTVTIAAGTGGSPSP